MSFEWKGVFPAMTTKFTASDELDLPLFEKNLLAQLVAGIHGVYNHALTQYQFMYEAGTYKPRQAGVKFSLTTLFTENKN